MRITHQHYFTLLLCLLIVAIVARGQEVDENDSSADRVHHQLKEEEKRLWGSVGTGGDPKEPNSSEDHAAPTTTTITDNSSNIKENTAGANPSIPFISKASATIPQYGPPQGFRIQSRVYTDPQDKLAHFDNDSPIIFPYWECGVAGSTTVPIPLQHATVRHLLGGSKPNLYSGEEFGPHPQLVIALTKLEVVLNSGQVQTFAPGDVILLEDVLSGGHKLKGHDQHDMTVMILTLPHHYHQVGKDKSSLKDIFKHAKMMNPCPTEWENFTSDSLVSFPQKMGLVLKRLQPRSIRKFFLTVVGLSISTLVGDFMGKVAPLWLAVVFGGGCFVAGGTFSFVKFGDYCLDELGTWQEKQQLRLESTETRKMEEEVEKEIHLEFEAKESSTQK